MPLVVQTQEPEVQEYLARLRNGLSDVPAGEQEQLLAQAQARIDLALEMEPGGRAEAGAVTRVLQRLGDPELLAKWLRTTDVETAQRRVAPCRDCTKEVSTHAPRCPHCGAPSPAVQSWTGFGYEWKSPRQIMGVPVVHVAFGRDARGKLRVAKGIVAIGQFGIGAITIAQFGVGALFGLGQFVVAPVAVGQFAFGLAALGQFGIGLLFGAGQIATGAIAHGMATFGNWFRR